MARASASEIEQIMMARKVVETLRSRLVILERAPTPDTPLFEIGRLRFRCDQTIGSGDDHWRSLSLADLKKDIARFAEDFPGLLASDLLEAVENAPEFYKPRPPR
jgi:hypothetical protein